MTVENVDAETLHRWLVAGKAVLVDVREPGEYEAEHIKGAELVLLGQIRRSALPDHAGRKLVIMCRMGGRGQSACQELWAEMSASEKIYNLEGGILAWKKAGFPVERKVRPAASSAPAAPSGWGGLFRWWRGNNA